MFSALARSISKPFYKLQSRFIKSTRIEPLLNSVRQDDFILEIGAGYNPKFLKSRMPHVFHLDHCDTQTLRAKYSADPNVAHLIDRIQPIDFVFNGEPIERLVPADLRFNVIYGSHVIEHQVDLIGHLQSLESLLKPGGRVIEMIPDLRTCFDCLRFPTVTSDLLVVHHRGAKVHQGRQIFDCLSRMLSMNPGRRIHDSDFKGAHFASSLHGAHQALIAAEAPEQPFRDLHAWAFTPESFRLLMIELRLLDLIRLAPVFVSSSFANQFCAVLERTPGGLASMTSDEIQALEAERLALMVGLRF
jgi:hypothetical protein